MSILLPASRLVRTAKPRLRDFGAWLEPPMGGPAQRLNRIGNRFAIDVEAATSDSTNEGRILVARLMQALSLGALLAFPQDMIVGVPGAPVVDGAGQLGTALNLRGFTPAYAAKVGQFFSLIQGGRRYLHFLTAQSIAGQDGRMTASIWPMLRVQPDDGAVCEFARPMIEGFIQGNQLEYQLQRDPYLDVSFTVLEAA